MDPYDSVLVIINDSTKRNRIVNNVQTAGRTVVGETPDGIRGAKLLQEKAPDTIIVGEHIKRTKIKEIIQAARVLNNGKFISG